MRRYLITAALAACAFAALPAAGAFAAPTCTVTTRVLAINYPDSTPSSAKATIQLNGSNFEVRDATGALIACGGGNPQPPVGNVDSILVEDNIVVGHSSVLDVNFRNGAFLGGGAAGDATGTGEIEVDYVAGDGTDQLQVDGTDNADNWLFGENLAGDIGANLDGDDDGDDITTTGVELADVNGGKGDDSVSAVGNGAVGGPIQQPLTLADGDLILEGGNQNDTIRGGAGNDKLVGGTQDDDLNGGGGNDTVDGSDDNDSLDGGVGADILTGGTGTDFATYADATGPVNVTLDDAANDGGAPDNFADNVRTDIENVKGGNGSDAITGSVLANELTGNGGNDTLDGGAGDDKVSGSAGIDRLLGNLGNDKLFGGTENDNMVGASGNDVLTGNAGKDIFLGKKGFDRLLAKDGAKDKKIDCGPGSNKRESFTRDRRDPKPKSC
jgi:Ca2+-binding RTX toxin-like protein